MKDFYRIREDIFCLFFIRWKIEMCLWRMYSNMMSKVLLFIVLNDNWYVDLSNLLSDGDVFEIARKSRKFFTPFYRWKGKEIFIIREKSISQTICWWRKYLLFKKRSLFRKASLEFRMWLFERSKCKFACNLKFFLDNFLFEDKTPCRRGIFQIYFIQEEIYDITVYLS